MVVYYTKYQSPTVFENLLNYCLITFRRRFCQRIPFGIPPLVAGRGPCAASEHLARTHPLADVPDVGSRIALRKRACGLAAALEIAPHLGPVGKADGKVTLRNCLFKPSQVDVTTTHCATLVRMGSPELLTLDNCYFVTSMGEQQGTDASLWRPYELRDALGKQQWYVVGEEVRPILFDLASFKGDGTEDSPYLIASIENWNYN